MWRLLESLVHRVGGSVTADTLALAAIATGLWLAFVACSW